MQKKRPYYDSLDCDLQKYFQILSPDYPEWIEEYVVAPEMQRLAGLSQTCAVDYLNFWDVPRHYNVLNHSVACCLIVWHFTRSQKQALAALFHDISTPAFKHCIDILNNDAVKQEYTEGNTEKIIAKSPSIRKLLRRDHISIKEISDYHQYPIADNDSPHLSADRLEYTFMNAYLVRDYGVKMPLSKIKRYYDNLIIGQNESGKEELAFLDYKIAEEFLGLARKLWHNWCDNRFMLTGQAYADIVQKSIKVGDLTQEELYRLTDQETIAKILHSHDSSLATTMRKFLRVKRYYIGDKKPQQKGYFITPSYPVKIRYLDPLVCDDLRISLHADNSSPYTVNFQTRYTRLSTHSEQVKSYIAEIQHYSVKKYTWLKIKI